MDEDWRNFIRYPGIRKLRAKLNQSVARTTNKMCQNRTERLSACVDFPMALYWRDLARLYPRAKVLLTVRDSA